VSASSAADPTKSVLTEKRITKWTRFEQAFHKGGQEGITVPFFCVCVLVLGQRKGELGKFLIFFKKH